MLKEMNNCVNIKSQLDNIKYTHYHIHIFLYEIVIKTYFKKRSFDLLINFIYFRSSCPCIVVVSL